MRWRQLLVPLGLIVVPGVALAWLMLGGDDPETSAPRSPLTAQPEPVAAPEPPREQRREPAPRRPSRPRHARDAPDELDVARGRGGSVPGAGGHFDEPEVGEAFPHPSYSVAVDRLEEGDPAAALEEIEVCLKEAPKHRGCWDAKLRAMMAIGDLEGARELVASCSESRDDPALCLGARAVVALEDGDVDAAQATLEAMEEQSPRSRFTMMARAQLYAQEGNDKMAKMNFTLACIKGHAVACRRAPGVKKAGGP